MGKFNAEEGWKTAKTISLGAGVVAGSFFLIRFFIHKMEYGNSQDKSLKATKNAHSYATELNIALANDKYFTIADKDEVLKILYEIPAKLMEEVKNKYHILTNRKRYLNDDLRKLYNIEQYRLIEELIRKKIEDAKFKKKRISEGSEVPTIAFNPKDIANHLHKNASEKNLKGVILALQQINDTVQYGLVNNIYKEIDFWGKTIVNHLLSYAFKDDNEIAKPLLKNEFLRMGLKVNPITGTWSLNGLRA